MAYPVAPLTGQPAIDYTQSRIGDTMPDGSGYCLKFVRQDFEIPSLYASAIDAWNASHDQHPDDRNPPPAVPMFFWSSSVYRHVAFHLGGGQYATTFNADIRSMSLSAMESSFGPVIGWAGDLNARLVWGGGTTPPPAGGFLMALTDKQQTDLYNMVANIAGWIYAGGPDVNAGRADPGSVGARTIHMDQVLAGAQATPGNALGRIMNIDRQVTGADGQEPSVSSRVIDIQDKVTD